MNSLSIRGLKLHMDIEKWPLFSPFRIAGYTFDDVTVLSLRLEKDGQVGRAEASGVYYRHETPESLRRQITPLRERIETEISRDSLQQLLSPGGARHALDCALWDLEAKLIGRPAWQIAGLETPRPLLTTFTCGAGTPEEMAGAARAYSNARAIKLKLTGDPVDGDRVVAVRESLPSVWLGVDANQGFTRPSLEKLMPLLVESRVELIEQPFPIGQEAWLDGLKSPIPVAADESVQSLAQIPHLAGRFQVMNIKLDKCGGLSEALAMTRLAATHGLRTMVGNMMGTSLGMAPAFLVGQQCQVVDLDGPAFLKKDREITVCYDDGFITCPPSLWGGGERP